MELPTSHDFLRMSVEEFDTTSLLRHASRQREERGFDKMLIVDVDAHHYESDHMADSSPSPPARPRPAAARATPATRTWAGA
jgi:hypothetical protein